MIMSRDNHFADIIYRKHLANAPKLVNKIAETVPDFITAFCFYYAMQEAAAPAKRSVPGKVYFMRDVDNGDIKIGFSENSVAARAKSHVRARQSDVETLLSVDGLYRDETDFHRMYAQYNIKDEWYVGNDQVLASINAMKRLAKTAPAASIADFMEEARWELLFYPKEAAYYKAIFS